MKIIDKKNQIEDIVNSIMESNEVNHYIILKNNGLLYITDLQDSINCVKSGKYKSIGVITKTSLTNNNLYIKDKVKELLKDL